MTGPFLFLDIDGVLNGHEKHPDSPYTTIRPDCVRRLNRVVRESGCKVVVSSAWRYMLLGRRPAMRLLGFAYLLHTHGFAAASRVIVGHTGADEDCPLCGHRHRKKARKWDEASGNFVCDGCGKASDRADLVAAWRESNAPGSAYAVVDDLDLGFTAARMPFVQTNGKRGLTDRDVRALVRLLAGGAGDRPGLGGGQVP